MARTAFCITLALAVALASGPRAQAAQAPARPKAPLIPHELVESERLALSAATLQLSRGKFDLASAAIKQLVTPAAIQVYVDWARTPKAVRPAWKQSGLAAIAAWNAALAGAPKFVPTDQADAANLRIWFERGACIVRNGQAQIVCVETRLDAAERDRRVADARISLNVPYSEDAHAAPSIGHLIAQALGGYLGMDVTESAADVMGSDSHTATIVQKPSAADIRSARQIVRVRAQLAALAQSRVAAYMPHATLVIEKPQIDAGQVERGDSAHYVFSVRNSGDAPLEITANPNCGCTVAAFDKTIAPGATGKITADLHTTGYRGRIMKGIEVTSNDPALPKMSLHLVATVLTALDVVQGETALIALNTDKATEKQLDIRQVSTDPIDIEKVTCQAAYVTTKLEPAPATAEGKRAWSLKVTIGTEAPMGRSVFSVVLHTTSKRDPQVNITGICDKGILPTPNTLYMGSIGPTTALPLSQSVSLIRTDGSFHVRKVTCDDPHLDVTTETVRDGEQYRVTARYKGGWPAGMVRAKLLVQTDDPKQPTVEIPVMASVAAGGK